MAVDAGVYPIAILCKLAAQQLIGYQSHPHEELVIPNGQTVLEQGSTILVVTKPALVHQMIDFLGLCTSHHPTVEVGR